MLLCLTSCFCAAVGEPCVVLLHTCIHTAAQMCPEVPINAEVPINIDSLLSSVQVTAKQQYRDVDARWPPGCILVQTSNRGTLRLLPRVWRC